MLLSGILQGEIGRENWQRLSEDSRREKKVKCEVLNKDVDIWIQLTQGGAYAK